MCHAILTGLNLTHFSSSLESFIARRRVPDHRKLYAYPNTAIVVWATSGEHSCNGRAENDYVVADHIHDYYVSRRDDMRIVAPRLRVARLEDSAEDSHPSASDLGNVSFHI